MIIMSPWELSDEQVLVKLTEDEPGYWVSSKQNASLSPVQKKSILCWKTTRAELFGECK